MREFKRQRGYITIAQNSGNVDYLRMAYALALSLRATQSEVPHLSVAVSPRTEIPKKYIDVFDEVIEMPWLDDARRFNWKIHNKWKVYYITPYKESVLLDSDMLFPTDVSHWWNIMSRRKMWATTIPRTYRGDQINHSFYREVFRLNKLPMVYSAFMYFKQDEEVHRVFDMAQCQVKNWNILKTHYIYRKTTDEDLEIYKSNPRFRHSWTHHFKHFPKDISGDVMFSIAMKSLGVESEWAPAQALPTFVHMKIRDQGLSRKRLPEQWNKIIPWSMKKDLTILVNNYVQRYPFHYCVKDLIDDEVISKLEKAS